MRPALIRRLAPLALFAVPLAIPVIAAAGNASAPSFSIPAAAHGVAFGTSFGGNMGATEKLFPNSKIARLFEHNLKAGLPSLPASEQIWLSFNDSPSLVASGKFNAQFGAVLQQWNKTGRTIYWDWQHEADNPRDHLNPATIRAGWAQLLSVEHKYPSSHVKSMSIYEGFLLSPNKPHGDPSLWYVPADVLGFDCYMPNAVVRAMNYAKAKGKPWAIPEFGNHGGDKADVAYITATINSWAPYRPIGAAWFNNTAAASFSQPLRQIPTTTAYLRALAG
jgi:hypothetical protein